MPDQEFLASFAVEIMKEKGNAPEKASVGAQNAQEGASDMSGYHSCHGP